MRWILRLLLAIIAVIYGAIGGFLLFVGSVYGVTYFSEFNSTAQDITAICLIAIGGVMVLIGLLGISCSCSRSFGLSYTFSFILLFSIIIEAIALILFIIFRPEVDNVIGLVAKQTTGSYGEDGSFYTKCLTYLWDGMQMGLECCGVYSFKDWMETEYGTRAGIPVSCCAESQVCDLNSVSDNPDNIYTEGCFEVFGKSVADRLEILIPIVAGTFALQILGVCFSCCLARSVQVDHCEQMPY
jgi:hypothetical protein